MSQPGQSRNARILELAVPICLIGIAAAFLWDARTLAGAGFDRLGPAPVPRLICWCVIVLCGVIIGQVYLARRTVEPSTGSADPDRDPAGTGEEDVKPHARRTRPGEERSVFGLSCVFRPPGFFLLLA